MFGSREEVLGNELAKELVDISCLLILDKLA